VRNPEVTRLLILDASAKLFNVKGYKATALSDITNATGLTKGAIYSHFENKDELERHALMHMMNFFVATLTQKVKEADNAKEKLLAIMNFFESYKTKPPFEGGCPVLNAAIEADDANPELKKVVAGIFNVLHNSIVTILSNGVKYKQLKKDINADAFASMMISSIEGAIVLMKVTNKSHHLDRVLDYLKIEFGKMEV